ncbi:MAG: hypothetical protein NE334_17380 [Lentisphaeraceae bacterium]|nr:hypothetical protein [Lentisphaeraceae bacterium]
MNRGDHFSPGGEDPQFNFTSSFKIDDVLLLIFFTIKEQFTELRGLFVLHNQELHIKALHEEFHISQND